MTADVVQHRLDDVRINAQLGHAGRHRSPDIVDCPRLYARQLGVELCLCLAEAGEATLALAEDEISNDGIWSGPDEFLGSARQRDDMRPVVLSTLAWHLKRGAIDLGPSEVGDLALPLAGQDQQFQNAAIVVITQREPDVCQLLTGENAIAGSCPGILVDVADGIDLKQSFTNRPCE